MYSFTMRHADFVVVSGRGFLHRKSAPGSFPGGPAERVYRLSFLLGPEVSDLAHMKGLQQAENLKKCQKLSDCDRFQKESPARIRAADLAMIVDPRLQAVCPFSSERSIPWSADLSECYQSIGGTINELPKTSE